MTQHVCLEQHWQLQLLLKGTSCAAVLGLQVGAENRLRSLDARALHQGLYAVFGYGGAWGCLAWRGAARGVGRDGQLPGCLSDLHTHTHTQHIMCVSIMLETGNKTVPRQFASLQSRHC